MGPKGQANKKTLDKQKQKIVEDKTFGLKNKKGAKQQKFIQHVQQNVQAVGGQKTAKELQRLKDEKETKKMEKLKRQEELKDLFKPVLEQKALGKGVDPKSVLCAYFKQGLCTKGDKCKFSHDLTKSRQSEKKSIYVDIRADDGEDNDEDGSKYKTCDDLNKMIDKKHGAANKNMPATTIVCKYFLEAVESRTYGWFWECPNGNDKCHYRHCLPEGYVLKSAFGQAKEDVGPRLTLEELIETERANLSHENRTPVTLETFKDWKRKKIIEKRQQLSRENVKKQKLFKQGRMKGLTGREMFTFDPNLVGNDDDDDDTGEQVDYSHRERDEEDLDEGPVLEIDLSCFTLTDAIDESLFIEEEDAENDQ